MTRAGYPRPALPRRLRLAAWTGACAVLAAAGCKSSGSKNTDSGVARGGDPILGNRIPPQNLPVPGRDAVGGRDGGRDPLLGLPTGDTKKGERAGGGAGDGNETASRSTKEPYRPGLMATNAALARPLPTDDTGLSIGDRRPPASAASAPRGPVPFRPAAGTGTGTGAVVDGGKVDGGKADGTTLADVMAELKRYGARVGEPERDGDQYVMRGVVPIDPADPTRERWYEEAGPTPAAAAKKFLAQARTDRGGK